MLRFGIPSLDELLEVRSSVTDAQPRAESATLIGPDGCGKSVLALHLASRYAADCCALVDRLGTTSCLPLVLYISSDFQVDGARKVWRDFGLNIPNTRQVPFERTGVSIDRLLYDTLDMELCELKPARKSGDESIAAFLLRQRSSTTPQIGFLDLARHTAGDDWNYVNGILGQLQAVERPHGFGSQPTEAESALPHLVIIDSVAGFETYVGKLDKYGLEQTRRARIAQCMRNAMPHCHLVFVVEEPEDGQRLPEEYVTDVVIRVRARSDSHRNLRTIEIEKARARTHALGEHPFEIRSKQGTSTAEWENADSPRCKNAYVQVFPALSHRSLSIALDPGMGRSHPNETVSPFGTVYLDELLSWGPPVTRPGSKPIPGLFSASTSAIIGDTSTGKSVLAERFIAEGFRDILEDAAWLFVLLTRPPGKDAPGAKKNVQKGLDSLKRICELLSTSVIGGHPTHPPPMTVTAEAASLDALRAALADSWRAGETASEVTDLLKRMEGWERPRQFALLPDEPGTSGRRAREQWRDAFCSFAQRERIMTDLRPDPPTDGAVRWPPDAAADWLTWLDAWAGKTDALPRSRAHFRAPSAAVLDELAAQPFGPAEAARFLIQLFRHPNLRYPGVLLTTGDRTVAELAHHCLQHLQGDLRTLVDDVWNRDDKTGKSEAPNELFATLWHILSEQLIVRRFDIENATAPGLFHAIQRNVLEAQRMVHGAFMPPRQENRFPKADRIRVVIDDCQVLSSLCPSVSADPTFLPFLTFFLEREGVTTLIVYTDAVRPNVRPVDPLNQTLQSLLKQVIMTWSVPFEGQSRIAVTVVPAASSRTNGIVRELELEAASPDPSDFDRALDERQMRQRRRPSPRADVTRNFELYSGLEEGRPRFVPLAVYLFNATDRFAAHIDYLNELFREMFVPVTPDSEHRRRVVWPLSVEDYLTLRDETHLPMGVQERHTTVMQVDAFWSLYASGGALAPQASYLRQVFHEDPERSSREDPFGLYRGEPLYSTDPYDGEWRRMHYFQNSGYRSRVLDFKFGTDDKGGMPDRVPFTWDFGFLLIRSASWERAASEPVFDERSEEHRSTGLTVGLLLERLQGRGPVSWRHFLGAAKVVAETAARETGAKAVPFDFAAATSETLNALILEIWFSEIAALVDTMPDGDPKQALQTKLTRLSTKYYVPDAGIDLVELLGFPKREISIASQFGEFDKAYRTWFEDLKQHTRLQHSDGPLDEGRRTETEPLFAMLPLGALALYRTWLLLVEVLPFEGLMDPDNEFLLRQKKDAAEGAVAARHWYRTACPAMTGELAGSGPHDGTILTRLPGAFSARGDSFLAAPASSRSKLLAAYAMDLLCSRRANMERLQMGIGLPVRDILDEKAQDLPTGLRTVMTERASPHATGDRSRGKTLRDVTYGELCAVGGKYVEDTSSTLPTLWFYRSAIKDYDRINRAFQKWLTRLFHWSIAFKAERGTRWRGGFEGYDALERRCYSPLFDYDSFHKFAELTDLLIAEINASRRHWPSDGAQQQKAIADRPAPM